MKTYKLKDIKNYPEYHKEMWNWISENPDKDKVDWFDEFWKDKRYPLNLCFGCEVARNVTEQSKFKPKLKFKPKFMCYNACGFSREWILGDSRHCCFGLWDDYVTGKIISIKTTNNFVLDVIRGAAKQIANLDCSWMKEI